MVYVHGSPPVNSTAITALASTLVLAPLGIIFGHIALNQIKTSHEGGRGLAIGGLVIGYLFTAIAIAWVCFFSSQLTRWCTATSTGPDRKSPLPRIPVRPRPVREPFADHVPVASYGHALARHLDRGREVAAGRGRRESRPHRPAVLQSQSCCLRRILASRQGGRTASHMSVSVCAASVRDVWCFDAR